MFSRLTMTFAQIFRVFGWCCALLASTVGVQQAALAQDAPRICVVAADADTGPVHAIGDFPGGGMLIGGEKGLFLARAADGKVTVTPVRGGATSDACLASTVSPAARR